MIAVVFNAGSGQTWTVPAGVTTLVDIYAWGAGGDGALSLVQGGGGGGGGAFANSGTIAVTPGEVFTVNVDAHGAEGFTGVLNPSAVSVVVAGSGQTPLFGNPGAAGSAITGVILQPGGEGGNAMSNGGGGGGGAAGNNAAGGAGGAGQNAGGLPGPGGGVPTLLGYGAGGNGGQGASLSGNAQASTGPGGGGGGSGTSGTHVASPGSDGLVVIFYGAPAPSAGAPSGQFICAASTTRKRR